VIAGESQLRAVLRTPDSAGRTEIVATRVDAELAQELQRRGVAYEGVPPRTVLDTLVVWFLPAVLVFWLWSFAARRAIGQQAGGVLGFGRSRARIFAETDIKISFEDVAGVDEAKAELREMVEFLRDPAGFGRLGARMPKGVLLVGPPGTGKTLLARAVAGEAGVPFFSINGSEFVELFVGVGAARVRDLFERARSSAPCIIFIDELDALGRVRGGATITGASDEKEQTLNQLLAELDGFDPAKGVVLLSATNRPEILDPALLRAGRFDRQIFVDRPDRAGRVQILRVHVRKIRIAPELDLDQVAALTPGFTGADINNLVNEAALAATRRDSQSVTLADFTVALERLVAGLARKSRVLSERERRITAVHEMGHSIVSMATPGADPVQKVSIIPHGIGALGFTLQRPVEERYIATRAELESKMTVLLGGRGGELVVFGELSTGASDDLVRATELAREMVMRHGMDETVGHVVYGAPAPRFLETHGSVGPDWRLYSEKTAREIEHAVRGLVQDALDRAIAALTANRDALDRGAALLQERETLTRDDLPHVTQVPDTARTQVSASSKVARPGQHQRVVVR
jgi:cell division protease FtsH